MYSNVYCGVDQLSSCTLALDFVSSVGLQAYDIKRKGQRSLFVFHVNGIISFFLLGLRLMMIATFTLCYERAFPDVLDGVVSKHFSWDEPPDPHLSSLSLPQ